jgi:hypothetical protein
MNRRYFVIAFVLMLSACANQSHEQRNVLDNKQEPTNTLVYLPIDQSVDLLTSQDPHLQYAQLTDSTTIAQLTIEQKGLYLFFNRWRKQFFVYFFNEPLHKVPFTFQPPSDDIIWLQSLLNTLMSGAPQELSIDTLKAHYTKLIHHTGTDAHVLLSVLQDAYNINILKRGDTSLYNFFENDYPNKVYRVNFLTNSFLSMVHSSKLTSRYHVGIDSITINFFFTTR